MAGRARGRAGAPQRGSFSVGEAAAKAKLRAHLPVGAALSAGTRLKAPGAAALAVAALAALALTGASDAGAQDRCTVRGAKTVVASGASRVFSVAIKRGRKYYGCVKGGRPVFLTLDYSAANS